MRTISWWLIRHAKVTELGPVIYGGLNPKGDTSINPERYDKLAQILPQHSYNICSNQRRTHDTYQAVFKAGWQHNIHAYEPAFCEQNFGDWHGKTHDDIAKIDPDITTRFWLTPAHQAAPNGESFADVYTRTSKAFINYTYNAFDNHYDHVVFFGHGGPIRAILGYALSMPLEHSLRYSIDNLSITRVDMLCETNNYNLYPRVKGVNQL